MPTREELYTALRNADKAGDNEGAARLASYIQSLDSPQQEVATKQSANPQLQQMYDASKPSDKSSLKDIGAGAIRGAGSIGATLIRPFESKQENDKRRQDMTDALGIMGVDTNSKGFAIGKGGVEIAGTAGAGGAIGKVVSKFAPLLGDAIASGGMTLNGTTGNALGNGFTRVLGGGINGGATVGLANPDQAKKGVLIGGAIPATTGTLGVVGGAIGDALKPFTEQGKKEILANFLKQTAGDDLPQVINNLDNAKGLTPGFNPTTGQASNNGGLAILEKTVKQRNPNIMQNIDESQRKALATAINNMGGNDLERQALVDSRDSAVEDLYKLAKSKDIPLDQNSVNLLNRPAVKQAVAEATINAANRKVSIGLPAIGEQPIGVLDASGKMITRPAQDAQLTGKTLHEIKMALDSAKNYTPIGGANKAQLNAIGVASNDFNNFLENAIPEYKQAKDTFANMSKPINQLDLGQAIADKYIPPLYRGMDTPLELKHSELAKILYDNGNALAKKTTGFSGSTLENTLNPQQLQTLKNAVQDTQYIKQGDLVGKGSGSDTFQKLAFNSQLENNGILGKLAHSLPSMGGALGALKSIAGVAYKGANKGLEEKLAQALLNPQEASSLMKMSPQVRNQELVKLLKNRYLGNAAAVTSAQ
jgi:hypothetical protein